MTDLHIRFEEAMTACPLIAILRGLKPEEAVEIGEALYAAGIRLMEVPLNSPRPLDSIKALSDAFQNRAIVGAGTVLTTEQVDEIAAAGGKLIVSPNTNPDVIKRAKHQNLIPIPGVFTPTEAFAAIEAGAEILKLFPADTGGPDHLEALKAVLPKDIRVLAVGGVGPDTYSNWSIAGADGAGCGSTLYSAGDDVETVRRKADALVAATKR
ncbi:MAG: 2-dehydro-3-deoxy-6-phosphogalactonate aldolase [Pseudomonadota bacterium]